MPITPHMVTGRTTAHHSDAWALPPDCSIEARNEMRAQIERETAEFERLGGKIKQEAIRKHDPIVPSDYQRHRFNNSKKRAKKSRSKKS